MDRPASERALTRRGRRPRRGYPALDGIRAVAVLAVMLYHFGVHGMGEASSGSTSSSC